MIKCALHQVLRLRNYILNLTTIVITFLIVFFLTPSVNFHCGKLEHPERTHDFRESRTHDLRGKRRSDDCTTKARRRKLGFQRYILFF